MDLSFKTGEELFQFILLIVLLGFTVILFIVVMNIFMLLKKLKLGANGTTAEAEALNEGSFWKSLTNAVPIAKEDTVMLDHNYDGIRELDNHLPPWWLGLLYGSIVFAVVYLLNYHVWHWSPSQQEEYTIAMDEGKKEVEAYQAKLGESIDEKSVQLVSDAKTLENGKTIFVEKCVACHGANGEGGVGPNLTDEYWIHGGTINDIFGVIKNGVPEKGMISWKATLKPAQIQEVSNYIVTLKGTNPENQKAPQGQKVSDMAVAADSTAAQ
ncbi:cytochrome oxidase subunit III [Lacihabitans sp. LS3-19]|uniref:cbb3-type cytochrome c oxidase N-terminal domain-containing protein n=1 Tax=Lacihabitans sp. LS3-19 TaxID=2487335 RepID=UPI0020CD1D63|nr:cbb3-type cytochrome c oxidase N-terminal domain-containing protein [Lacihabitans sp. LS3-19]MCP9766815.1 cytochrome oxidase subunit III [Lacihabitans sp. LS3-19]